MHPPPSDFIAALSPRYRIEREVGSGRMSTVYVAEDHRLGRRVAMKVLRPDATVRHADVRFVRETKLLAQLRHKNIVPLYDSGYVAGRLYYISSYIPGESLRHRLERTGPLPVDEAVAIARDVAEALEYAHHRGVIHRDVKPENILLGEDHALVADFGFAKAIGALSGAPVTTVGSVGPGTPRYMSPEQCVGGGELDGRADVYSLGVVMYEMLTGRVPYADETGTVDNALKYTTQPPPASSLRRGIPPSIDAAILRALEPSRTERTATAREFAQALATDDVSLTPARRTSIASRGLPLFAIIGAAVLMIAGIVAAAMMR
jgi:serine/threonine protein kinase